MIVNSNGTRIDCIKVRERGRNYRDPGTQSQEEQRALSKRGHERANKRPIDEKSKRKSGSLNRDKRGELRKDRDGDEPKATTIRTRREAKEGQKNLGRQF